MANVIHKYKNHLSIKIIKSSIGVIDIKFEFQHILPETVLNEVNKLGASKSASGHIPTKTIKDYINICCDQITDCFNVAVSDISFPKPMKRGVVAPAYKNDEKIKGFQRILGDQIYLFMNDKLCGFRKGYSKQYALINLLENWRHHLENKNIFSSNFL